MVAKTFYVGDELSLKIYQGLLASSKQQAVLMGHSLSLSLLTTVFATMVGMPLGVLLGKTDLPLRRSFTVLFTVPLLMPPYVLAVAWFAVLGKEGLIGHSLPDSGSALLSSWLFGLPGCTWVLFTAFLSIVILLTMVYLGAVNPRLEEAGRLVSRWPSVLRHITLPLIAPAILFAAVLVFLLTLGEVGVPTFLRYPVYPVETLTQFAAFYDFGAATAATVPLLVITLLILGLEYRCLHKRVLSLSAAPPGARRGRIELGPWRLPILGIVSGLAVVIVALPLSVLVVESASISAYVDAFSRASDSIVRSLAFSVIGATLLTVLGFFCGYLIHGRALSLWRGVDVLGLFLFTLPGTVIGIGLIGLWNTPITNVIYGTSAIIILGYLVQYTALPMRITAAILGHIPRSLEQAAELTGASWFMILWHIVVPLAKRGLIAAWLISYIFCLRDLGISMVVYPPGSDTLPVRIFTLMANGAPSLIAALCVILIVVTLLPLAIFGFWLRPGSNAR
ncbi:MAG: iron ABC transporter permease [Burkholderiales bacterium]